LKGRKGGGGKKKKKGLTAYHLITMTRGGGKGEGREGGRALEHRKPSFPGPHAMDGKGRKKKREKKGKGRSRKKRQFIPLLSTAMGKKERKGKLGGGRFSASPPDQKKKREEKKEKKDDPLPRKSLLTDALSASPKGGEGKGGRRASAPHGPSSNPCCL